MRATSTGATAWWSVAIDSGAVAAGLSRMAGIFEHDDLQRPLVL